MKKKVIFRGLLCIMTLLATLTFVSCSNDDDSSSGGNSSKVNLSGKLYSSTDNSVSLSFAESGNSVVATDDGIIGYATYKVSGSTVKIIANGNTTVLSYNSSTDSLYIESRGITLYRL